MDDFYFSIEFEKQAELKIKGSRFIGSSFKIDNPNQAAEILNQIRKREYSATHNCFAWQIGLLNDTQFKYSDDGEPSGTAGRPIYDIIEGNKLTNILLVVTRYFGGTKLGMGGLVRAYGDTASEVLKISKTKKIFLTDLVRIKIEFPLYNQLLRFVEKYEASILTAEFTDLVSVTVEVRQSLTEKFKKALIDLSGGKATIA